MASTPSPFKIGFAALLAQSLIAPAAFQLTSNSEVFLTGTAAVRFDDNVYQTKENKVDDFILQFSPGFELKTGNEAATFSRISYSHDFLLYANEDDNNANLANIDALGVIQTARSSIKVNAGFQQLEGNTRDFLGTRSGDLIRRDTYNVGVRVENAVTAKVSVAGGARLDGTDYEAEIFADRTLTSVPLNVYYKFRPKLDLSVGYEFRDTSLGEITTLNFATPNPNDTITFENSGEYSHFFNVGARGELTPKLTADLRVGAELRDSRADGSTDWTAAIDGTLTWAASEKTSYQFLLGRRFDTSGTAEGLTRSNIAVIANYNFSEQLRATAEVSYERSEYANIDRDDDFFEFSLGSSYQWNSYLTLSGGYVLRLNRSSVEAVDFTNNVASISATFRY